tara:strand:+ start:391 stop:900 length:510 start_codon:yes stop_codon:yes gene_type:complete
MVEQEVIDCMNDMIKTLERQEAHRVSSRKSYQKNKDKVLQQKKESYQKNKDKVLEKRKEYYIENKDKVLQKKKEYYDENKDKIREYQNTEHGWKLRRINSWKHQGIICDNWDALYDHYLKTSFCDLCKVELTYDKVSTATTKCVDHDHSITDRPNFRAILCVSCNLKRR